MSKLTLTATLLAAVVTASLVAQAADNKPAGKDEPAPVGYEGTPQIPGSQWRVHQTERPQPRVVTPGGSCIEGAAQPPADAVILFDGKDLSKWCNDKGGPAKWKVENGYIEVVPKTGYMFTKDEFGDVQLHLEWRPPTPPKGDSQKRSNSGVFFFGKTYETQILDSFKNRTYADGHAGAVYGQYPPLVNAVRPPGEWQSYDIIFTAPKFDGDKVVKPATVTAFINGIVVQNHAEYLGASGHKKLPVYKPHGPKGPIGLQDHGDPIRFRNIWLRELKGYDE